MPFKSQAQRRFMYWAEAHGKVPSGTAEKWEEHTPKGRKLPEKVSSGKSHHRKKIHHKKAFVDGFFKTAVMDLSEEARYNAIVPMQDYVKGSRLYENRETGQARKGNYRTQNVRNEDREFTPAILHKWKNARQP